VTTDASARGWGAVLSQINEEGHDCPVAFASGLWNRYQQRYGACEREALAAILGLEKWHDYLAGGKNVLITDCRGLEWLRKSANATPKLFRWSLRLTEFDLDVIHKPGILISHVDALSRSPDESTSNDDPTDDGNDLLPSHISPLTSPVKEEHRLTIEKVHQHPWVAHPSAESTERIMRSLGYQWSSMKTDIQYVTKQCDVCQRSKSDSISRAGTGALPPAWVPFQRIGVDICGPYPPTKLGNRYVVVAVDAHSRFPIVIPTKVADFQTVQRVLHDHIFTVFGVPMEIVSDNTALLDGKQAKAVWAEYGISKIQVSPYHQSSNGLVERHIRTLLNAIRSMEKTKDWDERAILAAASLRYRPSSVTGLSPFEIVFGRRMNTPLVPEETVPEDESDSPKSRDELWKKRPPTVTHIPPSYAVG
jgi:hypothetical protein